MISFDNFCTLHPGGQQVSRDLVEAARHQNSIFASFMLLWMGFNGWMECVTEAATDAGMITDLSSHTKPIAAYKVLLANDPVFKEGLTSLEKMLPVLNVRDVRQKLGADAFLSLGHDKILLQAGPHKIKYQPTNWTIGTDLSWEQLLRTLYTVRCNLFHGAKTMHDHRDYELVEACRNALQIYVDRTGCLDWHD